MKSSSKSLYVVILAGGSGTRFWPLSRKDCPKQFLSIIGKKSLLQQTIERVNPLVPPQKILIVGSAQHKSLIKKQTASFKIPSSNILLEPKGKNTAPSVAWAAAKIHSLNPEAVMAVLPADHLITKPAAFLKVLRQAVTLAKQDCLVTMGIVPTRAETGYGYLQTALVKQNNKSILKVKKFTEKPPLPKAKQFLKKKNYLWNSGMFVWKAGVILEEFKGYLPIVHKAFQKGYGPAMIRRFWSRLPNISIDYGILEKSKRVVAVPAQNIGWSDLGSWESLAAVLKKDNKGNILQGDILSLDCQNTLIRGDQRTIAAIGLKDVVIVDTPDALLVCRKDQSQKVKDIVLKNE